jgi:hypothetical protein
MKSYPELTSKELSIRFYIAISFSGIAAYITLILILMGMAFTSTYLHLVTVFAEVSLVLGFMLFAIALLSNVDVYNFIMKRLKL